MAENYSSGLVPLRTDPSRVLEVKILNALTGASVGGSPAGGVFGIDYSGPPTFSPVTGAAFAIDPDRRVWTWKDGVWA